MKKIISLIIASLMLITLCCGFASCNKDENVLVMATNAAFPPYEYLEGDKFVGIDVEIAQAIADKLGMELVIEDMEFNSIISYVNANDNAFGMAGMTVTEDRKKTVDFTTSYAKGIQSVIVKADSDIKSIDDLAGKKIGVQLSTTGDIYATDDFGTERVSQYSKGNEAVAALLGGDIDCVIIDNEPAKAFVAANKGLKILETEYAVEDYAAAISKENKQLQEDFNKALKELKDSGKVAEIIEKYIPSEATDKK